MGVIHAYRRDPTYSVLADSSFTLSSQVKLPPVLKHRTGKGLLG